MVGNGAQGKKIELQRVKGHPGNGLWRHVEQALRVAKEAKLPAILGGGTWGTVGGTIALRGLPIKNFHDRSGACRSRDQERLGTECTVVQAVLMGILQRFGNLSHQAKAYIDSQRLTSVTQEPVEALGLGIVLKDQGRTALVLMQVEGFKNTCVVDALQQPELPLCSLPSRTAAELC